MFPVLAGVILLVGLFRGFVSRDLLMTVFSGNVIQDTLWGACIGSVLSGNPVTSYVIGETLLKMGVSLFGATALIEHHRYRGISVKDTFPLSVYFGKMPPTKGS